MKNKINIEITQDGWTTDILFNGTKYRERHERIPTGSKCVEGDFESEEELPDDTIGAVGGFFCFDCMIALRRNEGEKQ